MAEENGKSSDRGNFPPPEGVFVAVCVFPFDPVRDSKLPCAFTYWTADMFATIRKHQQWLWIFIIAAVIISFVIYFTPTSSNSSRGSGGGSFGSLDGQPLTRRAYMEAWQDVRLSYFLRTGNWPDQADAKRTGFNVDRETRMRLVLLARLKKLNVQVDEASIAQWIVERFSSDRQAAAAKQNYENFVKREMTRAGMVEADLQRFIRNEVGIAHLAAVAGVAGKLTTPREATALYRQEQEKVETEAAVFSLTNFLASVKVEPSSLAQFYTNRQSLYAVPERIEVYYVRFPLTNYFAQADARMSRDTNLSVEIDRAYLSAGPQTFTDTNGQVMSPEAAKTMIRERARNNQALLEARKAAAGFAVALDAIKPTKAENLKDLATSSNMVVGVTEPFGEMSSPKELKVRSNFAELAFKLTEAEPISPPIGGEDGFYLVALRQRIPREIPPLDNIRSRVVEDFTRDQALTLARQAATNLHTALVEGLAQGKSFVQVCTASKVTPILIPTFTPSTRALPDLDRRLDFSLVRSASHGVEVGKVSELMPTRDGGFVLHVKGRTAATEAELKAELPKYLATLRQSMQFEAFNDWFRTQYEQSGIDIGRGQDAQE